MVAFARSGEKLVGQIARRQAVVNPENTFSSVKRFIGRKFSEVQADLKEVQFKVEPGDSGNVKIKCPQTGRAYAPEELSAEVLRKLAGDASKFLGAEVSRAVITVPAYFNDAQVRATLWIARRRCVLVSRMHHPFRLSQRQATKDAGRIAGLDTLRIINEPTAASLAYGFDKARRRQWLAAFGAFADAAASHQVSNETILVFDLGGGTFDVSLLEVGDGVFEVLATSGDTRLGGDDFDQKIVNWLMSNFKRDEGIDLSKDRGAMQRLTEAAVKGASAAASAGRSLGHVSLTDHCPLLLIAAKEELSSLTQVAINLPFITATQDGPKHIDGSLTRAKFESLCEDLFERCRGPVERVISDAKLSVDAIKEVVLVGGSTRIPRVQQLVRELTGKEANLTVNPDEVVALGAAVQAGVLSGEVGNIVLLDVTPLSLGVETLGGVMTKLIPRNTTLPTTKSETFSTAADSQTSVDVHVLQGEREFAADNKSLGTFKLEGIPPAPRGVPQIEVSFDISADGILRVSARDKASNKRADISITGASTLSKEDVARATAEAERYAEADHKRRELVDARNEAESAMYAAGKQFKEFKEKVPADVTSKVQTRIDELARVAGGEDAAAIKAASTALREAASEIGKAVYAQQQQQQPPPGGAPGGDGGPASPGGPGVIDAEFTDSK